MKTKKTPMEKFINGVESQKAKHLDDNKGYIIFAYNDMENEQESTFAVSGKISSIAECLYSCMKKDAMLANIVIAASNAIVQSRMMKAGLAQAEENNENTNTEE